jgi:hypothetical protein
MQDILIWAFPALAIFASLTLFVKRKLGKQVKDMPRPNREPYRYK